jgi:hypothetical protein
MTIPRFRGDENKDEINLEEWLGMIKEMKLSPLKVVFYLRGEFCFGGISLMKVLKTPPHGEILNNSSQLNGLRIQKGRRCIKFKSS